MPHLLCCTQNTYLAYLRANMGLIKERRHHNIIWQVRHNTVHPHPDVGNVTQWNICIHLFKTQWQRDSSAKQIILKHENSLTLTDKTQDLEVSCGFCGFSSSVTGDTDGRGECKYCVSWIHIWEQQTVNTHTCNSIIFNCSTNNKQQIMCSAGSDDV